MCKPNLSLLPWAGFPSPCLSGCVALFLRSIQQDILSLVPARLGAGFGRRRFGPHHQSWSLYWKGLSREGAFAAMNWLCVTVIVLALCRLFRSAVSHYPYPFMKNRCRGFIFIRPLQPFFVSLLAQRARPACTKTSFLHNGKKYGSMRPRPIILKSNRLCPGRNLSNWTDIVRENHEFSAYTECFSSHTSDSALNRASSKLRTSAIG